MHASSIIHEALGTPNPCDAFGVEVPQRGSGTCAACGGVATYALSDTISENFVHVKNANRAWAFGGDAVCAACVFAARTLRLRVSAWWATPSGVSFWRTRAIVSEDKQLELYRQAIEWWGGDVVQPDGVSELCSPPEPPFVAGLPLFGISNGGETHVMRTWWPGESEHRNGYLSKLQSKHVAIYARIATRRERYPLQVDDQIDVVVDVALWQDLHRDATELLRDMSGIRVGAKRDALLQLRPPQRAPLGLVRDWNHRVRRLRHHANKTWWPLFVGLLPVRKDGTT